MGLADIAEATLESRAVRSAIGDRIFNSSLDQQDSGDGGGSIVSTLLGLGGRLLGFLVGSVGSVLGFSLSLLWGMVTNAAQFIWNFNWNISDSQIDQQIQQKWNAISGMLGGTLGNALGYLGCGVLPGATIFSFNAAMGAYVLGNVGEEMAEEFLSNLSNLIRYTFMSGIESLILSGFKNIRHLIKSNSVLIGRILGDNAEAAINAWGASGSKPWSFALATEEAVESISNEAVKNFVEEFLEESWEGCVEAGYVVANSIESFIALEKLKQQQLPSLGKTRFVEITPDRSIESQKIVLAGPEQVLKSQIVSTLSNYQMMEDKDIGAFVGAPLDDYLRAKPRTITLVIQFFSNQQPPWAKVGTQRLISSTCQIPDIKRERIDWARIKLACGGTNGFMFGRFRVTGLLNNGRQMTIYGASADEAEERLRALLYFSDAELIKKPTITEDRTEDTAGSYIKQPRRIYPAYFTIFNQFQVPGAPGGSIPINGQRFIKKQERIDLWTDQEPLDFDLRIQELLRQT
ncbi:hypothetical protein [Nodularia sphaerocarpa]|uniref:hypothetical protein n=1 Tax=Nodularia sphaerocarpa TaxID=137816 RepID=UPI001EFA9971|nr:hypothetical protein [Nodularia sphaerocarpa]MDB9375750.1 hypothetical protein [Nodularia sphaerocarpa CS-585]MDB9377236.1 hypothetical protein [Nodularia sphaerocarpa CS-585A2]ULP73107.1 hypothetical protein BDGGKGIB_02760 [Nodularia sphaerocarpa UHCC 0038]